MTSLMPDEPIDQRVALVMRASELREVDDWSFAHRIRSRGEAIRRLIKLGLETSAEREGGPAKKSGRAKAR